MRIIFIDDYRLEVLNVNRNDNNSRYYCFSVFIGWGLYLTGALIKKNLSVVI